MDFLNLKLVKSNIQIQQANLRAKILTKSEVSENWKH
jgi:hypothetical protein